MEQILQEYEPLIKKCSRFYYGLYFYGKPRYSLDLDDFEQAGRIAVWKVSEKRPEMLKNKSYVTAAIKYTIIGEIKKMRIRQKEVYLTREEDKLVQLVDILPTQDRSEERFTELEELSYRIKQDFSAKESEALEALIEKCDNVYDLNLSEPPSTDTKERVKVVTRLDLTDEEMLVYAQVLLGVKNIFPGGYLLGRGGSKRMVKYAQALFKALEITPRDFGKFGNKKQFFGRYKLLGFFKKTYNLNTVDFLKTLDPHLSETDMFHVRKWEGQISFDEILQKVKNLVKKKEKQPEEIKKEDFVEEGLRSMLSFIFGDSPKLAIECSHPGTYPLYSKDAERMRILKRGFKFLAHLDPAVKKGKRGYRGYENPLVYFRAHPEKFKGKSRTGLQQTDSSLYSSLINWGQLDEAIP